MKNLTDLNPKNKTVLIRVDLNVPLNDQLEVTDDTRIQSIKETVKHLQTQGAKIILSSHLGRPKGQKNDSFSLRHLLPKLSETLRTEVQFVPDSIGEKVTQAITKLEAGDILLLENLRFYPEEEKGDRDFAKALANLADIYVNDAFGTAHRSHASTAVIAQFMETKCFGKLMEKELRAVANVLDKAQRPVVAIVGGAKVSSKVPIIRNLMPQVDTILIGGGMSYSFSKALGGNIGSSLCEDDQLQLALDILKEASDHQTEILLPKDNVIADKFDPDANTQIAPTGEIPDGWMGLDIGLETRTHFASVISKAKTILWNGPLGVFEMEKFSKGTRAVGDAVEQATQKGAFSLVGGGDSVAAVKQFGYADKVSYVSTGGGAMLEALEGKTLPGVAAILD